MASGIGRRRAAALAEGGAAYTKRRTEILTAAARIFREKGFSRTSLADIAEALDTDRASLYYYFASKEQLFHEIVRDASEANAAQAEEIRDSDLPVPDKIAALAKSLMSSYDAHYPYLFVYIQEDLSKVASGKSSWARQMHEINRRYDDAVVAIVRAGIDDGSIRSIGSARVIANGIIGMLNWTHRWYHSDTAMVSAEEIGDSFADMVLNGLRTKRRVRSK
jgi:TetR/AcrR family transcriptional regulator, cholesterol catabolism regulator